MKRSYCDGAFSAYAIPLEDSKKRNSNIYNFVKTSELPWYFRCPWDPTAGPRPCTPSVPLSNSLADVTGFIGLVWSWLYAPNSFPLYASDLPGTPFCWILLPLDLFMQLDKRVNVLVSANNNSCSVQLSSFRREDLDSIVTDDIARKWQLFPGTNISLVVLPAMMVNWALKRLKDVLLTKFLFG